MLTLNGIGKYFQDEVSPILQEINLTLAAGESVAIMGASGSGKSTLLNVIAGLVQPSSGTVSLDSQNITELSQARRDAWRSENLGLVFQQFNLIDCLNVEDNIALPARYLRKPEEPSLSQLLDALAIKHLRTRTIDNLSGGEQQRVAIARALVHQPKLILADEPTGNLDEATSERVGSVLFSLAKNTQTSLLVVTHSNDIASQADRILHLKKGTLV